eukprot:4263963-Pleurochrysis_carterae.AAC.1
MRLVRRRTAQRQPIPTVEQLKGNGGRELGVGRGEGDAGASVAQHADDVERDQVGELRCPVHPLCDDFGQALARALVQLGHEQEAREEVEEARARDEVDVYPRDVRSERLQARGGE